MHPFERPSAAQPEGVSPHLDVRLKPGWRFDRRRRALVSEGGQSLGLRNLGRGTRVVPMVPTLAAADPATLSEDERHLARYLQVVPLAETDAAALADRLRALEAVEAVSTPPRISLPHGRGR
jgi:hypothetical protein